MMKRLVTTGLIPDKTNNQRARTSLTPVSSTGQALSLSKGKHNYTWLCNPVLVIIFTLCIIFPTACKSTTSPFSTQPVLSSSNVPAAKLVFKAQPGGAIAGTPFSTQPVISIEDAAGNIVADASASVTIIITSGTGTRGAVLSGTRTVNAVNGEAVFTDLSVNLAGQYYALTAMSRGLTSAISHSFNVSPGAAARLIFIYEPVGAAAGTYFGTQPVVAIEDIYGNIVTGSSAPVTVAITPGTGTDGAVLSGGTTVNTVNGIATFAYLAINLMGSEYTLTATSPGLTQATSDEFYITAPTTQ